MANTKISALTAATLPLDGTEVLPIVQSGATKKVSNNDLRPKQVQSNATSGVLQIAGPAAASTRVMTTPNANFTVARTDAANTFTGDQTINGNLAVNGQLASKLDSGGTKTFYLAAGGGAASINILTPTLANSDASIVVEIRMLLNEYSNNGAASYVGYIGGRNAGGTFSNTVNSVATTAIYSTCTAPTLAWTGISGTSATLQITNNQSYSGLFIQVAVSMYSTGFTFA